MAEGSEFGFIGAAFGAIGAKAFLAVTAGAITVGFLVCLFLSIFKCGYGLKKRLWYLILVFIFSAILKLRANAVGENDFSPLLSVFGLILFLPVYFIRVKAEKNSTEHEPAREYVRLLEDKIKRANVSSDLPSASGEITPNFNTEVLKAEPEPPQKSDKPDFSHVKNVLQRLEPALLTFADRRQIHELELSICEAESGEYSEETRRKINEGLGNLLKIMARHGV